MCTLWFLQSMLDDKSKESQAERSTALGIMKQRDLDRRKSYQTSLWTLAHIVIATCRVRIMKL